MIMVQAFFNKLKRGIGKTVQSASGKILGTTGNGQKQAQSAEGKPIAAQAMAIVLDMAASGKLGAPGEGARRKGLEIANYLMQHPDEVNTVLPQIRENPGSANITTAGGSQYGERVLGPGAEAPPGTYDTGGGTITGGAPTPINKPAELNDTGTPFSLSQWYQMIMNGDVEINRVPRTIINQLLQNGIMSEEEYNSINQNYYQTGQAGQPKALPQLPYSPEQVTQVISNTKQTPGPVRKPPTEVL
jgi:hypothetical protein